MYSFMFLRFGGRARYDARTFDTSHCSDLDGRLQRPVERRLQLVVESRAAR